MGLSGIRVEGSGFRLRLTGFCLRLRVFKDLGIQDFRVVRFGSSALGFRSLGQQPEVR